jgi:hypothetical protein
VGIFADQMLVHLSDPARLVQFLTPPDDPERSRLRALLGAAYTLPFARLHEIRDVKVTRTSVQRPLLPLRRRRSTWTQTMPTYTRTDVASEADAAVEPIWLDLSTALALTVVLEVDAGEIESIVRREIGDFATLAEFRDRFRYLDLEAFLAEHNITTVEELRAHAHYLLAEIKLRPTPPFDANDPANQHRYTLNVAILIREVIDLVAALRAAQLARSTMERTLTYLHETDTADVRTPYAPLVIFPAPLLEELPFTAAEIGALFASEGILAVFVTPPP